MHLHCRSLWTLQDPCDLTRIVRRRTARTPRPELVGTLFEMADLLPEVPAHETDPLREGERHLNGSHALPFQGFLPGVGGQQPMVLHHDNEVKLLRAPGLDLDGAQAERGTERGMRQGKAARLLTECGKVLQGRILLIELDLPAADLHRAQVGVRRRRPIHECRPLHDSSCQRIHVRSSSSGCQYSQAIQIPGSDIHVMLATRFLCYC